MQIHKQIILVNLKESNQATTTQSKEIETTTHTEEEDVEDVHITEEEVVVDSITRETRRKSLASSVTK